MRATVSGKIFVIARDYILFNNKYGLRKGINLSTVSMAFKNLHLQMNNFAKRIIKFRALSIFPILLKKLLKVTILSQN